MQMLKQRSRPAFLLIQTAMAQDDDGDESFLSAFHSEARDLEETWRNRQEQDRLSLERFIALEKQAYATTTKAAPNDDSEPSFDLQDTRIKAVEDAHDECDAKEALRNVDSDMDAHSSVLSDHRPENNSFGDSTAWGDVDDLPSFVTTAAPAGNESDFDIAGEMAKTPPNLISGYEYSQLVDSSVLVAPEDFFNQPDNKVFGVRVDEDGSDDETVIDIPPMQHAPSKLLRTLFPLAKSEAIAAPSLETTRQSDHEKSRFPDIDSQSRTVSELLSKSANEPPASNAHPNRGRLDAAPSIPSDPSDVQPLIEVILFL
jgi:hypothetical protein